MKFEINDTVKILSNHKNVDGGRNTGVIIMAFDNPEEAYEVEVVNNKGEAVEIRTFLPNEIEKI